MVRLGHDIQIAVEIARQSCVDALAGGNRPFLKFSLAVAVPDEQAGLVASPGESILAMKMSSQPSLRAIRKGDYDYDSGVCHSHGYVWSVVLLERPEEMNCVF